MTKRDKTKETRDVNEASWAWGRGRIIWPQRPCGLEALTSLKETTIDIQPVKLKVIDNTITNSFEFIIIHMPIFQIITDTELQIMHNYEI